MNNSSTITDLEQNIENLYSQFSNKLNNFTNKAKEREQAVSEAINDINSRKITKTMYDEMMTRVESKKSSAN